MKVTKSLLALITAYDSGTPGWKKDDNGNIVLKDGNPIYVTTSGQEQTVDGTTISAKNAEAKQHRERAEAAEAKLKNFDGLDPELARKAIETVGKIDAKTLIDAGKVDEVKKQITDQFTAQLNEKDGALKSALSKIDDMQISGIFKDSDFLRDGIAVPRDFVESAYRSNFKIENGKVLAYDKAGNQIMSKERLGELATPDEALRLLVESRADKDLIIKADVGNGSGNGGGSGVRGKGNVLKRSEWDKMDPQQQSDAAAKQASGELKIVD
jgi:hypothetical protein